MSEVTERSTQNPIVYHLNTKYRPESAEERKELVARAADNLCLKEAPTRLLQYTTSLGERDTRNRTDAEAYMSDVDDGTQQFQHLGLIAYKQYNYIKIDWYHIWIAATYINKDRAANKWRNAEALPVEPERSNSIRATLRKESRSYIPNEGQLKIIESMNDDELQILIERFRNL